MSLKFLQKLDARILDWELDDLIVRDCPFCKTKGDSPVFVRPDKLMVAKCAVCKAWYLPQVPSPRQIEMFYSSYDKTHRRTPPSVKADYIPMLISKLYQLNHLKEKRFLDVGFGRGHFLSEIKKHGGKIAGVELDREMISYTVKRGLLDIWQGTIFDVPLSERFDVILLGDLIEHLINPSELLSRAISLLNQGGLLAIITPNGATADIDDSDLVIFRVDLEHLQYLTPETIHFLAEKFQVNVIHFQEYGYPNLFEIDKKPADMWMTRTIATIPGFSVANKFRQWITYCFRKTGRYHLFSILKKE
ncbi:MAG: hypothetical protein BWK78_07910 [Thiotrichaceae bacterium IS1]|nr:MAG: hypothetical protein BWK78_07910 [Thiotrichaceae bacterium IS1]